MPRRWRLGVAAVDKLLGELRVAARQRARAEHDELTAYAREKSGRADLELALWDVAFWAERLREERYAYSDEELRPYFPLPRRARRAVRDWPGGCSTSAIAPADGEAPVWHPDVRFFRVADARRVADIAAFYLDPYSRPADKRGGAWMDDAASDRKRRADGSRAAAGRVPRLQSDAARRTDKPSLMTFREVETLFHEFGHGLQHMLTDRRRAGGGGHQQHRVGRRRAARASSWRTGATTARRCSRSPGTTKPARRCPEELFDKIVAARTFRAGSARSCVSSTSRRSTWRCTLGSIRTGDDARRPPARRWRPTTPSLPPLPEDRFLCSFSHIFAGGYAAGYYSYKWAEVLSADAFAAFDEAGLDDPSAVRATGRRFRDTVLALGGSRHPMEVFKEFRGREPSTRPLLEQTGLVSLEQPGPM